MKNLAVDSLREQGNRLIDGLSAGIVNQLRTNSAICWIGGVLIVAVSLYFRSTMFLGGDSAFYYIRAEELLAGRRIYYDFFEPNFPLNFYIYTLPVMLAASLGIGKMLALNIFITLISLISILACSSILKKTVIYQDRSLYSLLILGLFWGHFLPIETFRTNEFATKTVFFFSFIGPYLCYAFCEIEGKALAKPLAILIGIFVGLAVCLKPDYALFPIAIEGYFLIKKRRFWYILRPVNYAMLSAFLLHLAWLILCVPDYLFKVLPMVMVSYPGGSQYALEILFETAFKPQLHIFLLAGVFFMRSARSAVNEILLLAWVITTVIRGIHGLESPDQSSLPAFFMGLLLIKMMKDILEKKVTFRLYQTVFLAFSLAITLLLMIASYVPMPQNAQPFKEMLAISRTLSKKDFIYVMSGPDYAFPLRIHAEVSNYNKIGNFYLLMGLENNVIKHPHDALVQQTKQYFIDAIIEGITKYPPKVIFIQDGGLILEDRCLPHYIDYFSEYEAFRVAWKNYHFYKRIPHSSPGSKQSGILVYMRNDSEQMQE